LGRAAQLVGRATEKMVKKQKVLFQIIIILEDFPEKILCRGSEIVTYRQFRRFTSYTD